MENFKKVRNKTVSNYVCLILEQEGVELIHRKTYCSYYYIIKVPNHIIETADCSSFSFILRVSRAQRNFFGMR